MPDQDLPPSLRWHVPFIRLLHYLLLPCLQHTRLVLSLIALAVSLCWIAWDNWRGGHRIYSPGPVALRHQNLDCKACHVQSWQPVERLFGHDPRTVREGMDQACIACHQGLVHQRQEIPSAVPNCVSCHREHQGRHGLAVMPDQFCTACHANLHTTSGPSTRFAPTVLDFATHPEFAVHRRKAPDPGTLRFNHALHQKPEGLRSLHGKAAVLQCASCHEPAADGRTMKPIRFQDHCANCHSNALVYDNERFRSRPVPHGFQPELLRGWLQLRYTSFIQGHPEELNKTTVWKRPLPGRSSNRESTRQDWTWVQHQVNTADRLLFQHSGGCRYCHPVEATERGWSMPATDLRERWLVHGKFSHFSHRLHPKAAQGQENCTACHEGVRTSEKTSDVLLPSIQKCQECHTGQGGPQQGKTACIECHVYHNHIGGRADVWQRELKP